MATRQPNNQQRAQPLEPKMNFLMDLLSVKFIFLVHFFLMATALAFLNWMPSIYLYYNTFFFLALFWSSHTRGRNPEPLLLAVFLNGTAIVLDIVCICTTYNSSKGDYRFSVSLVFLILNLVLRPFTGFILARHYFSKKERHSLAFNSSNSVNTGPGTGTSTLNSAVRKILFLNSYENSEAMHSANIDSSGVYRAGHRHQNLAPKNSTPLTAVLSVPNGTTHPQQQQESPVPHAQPQGQSQHTEIQSISVIPEASVEISLQKQVEAQLQQQAEVQPVSVEPQFDSQLQTVGKLENNQENSDPQSPIPKPPPRSSRNSMFVDPETGDTYQERMI